ncbi:MAG: FKBP-type peptidyl-prolyl cis-trans isomerase, partial [Bdellovibrionales bacterium]|nr:FKBP-type peptidyl-prolyl cis-trans isomerase [Bdellovibrionales bacterium]
MKQLLLGTTALLFALVQTAAAHEPHVSGDAHTGEMMTTSSGLKYHTNQEGTGETAKAGNMVSVHYTGWLYENGEKGKKFDSSVDRGQPFVFPLGQGRVIKGWDEGVQGMKVGEKRTLIIPPDLGYGAR